MGELGQALEGIGANLLVVIELLILWLFRWSVVIAWFAWWLWGVDWRKVWPVLSQGAWVIVCLAAATAALVWYELMATPVLFLGVFPLWSFWRCLVAVCFLLALTLFAGWLQGVLGWQPAAVNVDPPLTTAEDSAHAHH